MSDIAVWIKELKKIYGNALNRIMQEIAKLSRLFPENSENPENPEDTERWQNLIQPKINAAVAEYTAVEKKLQELERLERSPKVMEYLSFMEILKIQASEKQHLGKLLALEDVRSYLAIPALAKLELTKEMDRLQGMFTTHMCNASKGMGPDGDQDYVQHQIAIANSCTEMIKVVKQKIASLDA
jgi:hypothetical protein